MTFRKHIIKACLCVMALVPASCRDSRHTAEPGAEGMVRLVFRVGVNSPGASGGTRAGEFPEGYPYDFEDPATEYENVRTLRVILVNNYDNRVIGNSKVQFDSATAAADELYGPVEFNVKGGLSVRAYLVANEESLGSESLESYAEGSYLNERMAQAMTIETAAGAPIVDNDGDDKKYVPMSEFFDIDVPVNEGPEPRTDLHTMFITRAAVKFAFTFTEISEDGSNSPFTVTGITINSLGNKEFLFPNNTVYSPVKDFVSLIGSADDRFPQYAEGQPDRIITGYSVPGDSEESPYTFRPQNLTVTEAGKTFAYAPQKYFAETRRPGAYTVTVKCRRGDDTEAVTMGPVTLPNMPDMPRNTFVKVDFTVRDHKWACEVELLPYGAVSLAPDFGLIVGPNYVPVLDDNGIIIYWYDPKNGAYYGPDKTTPVPDPYISEDPETHWSLVRDDNNRFFCYHDIVNGLFYATDKRTPVKNPFEYVSTLDVDGKSVECNRIEDSETNVLYYYYDRANSVWYKPDGKTPLGADESPVYRLWRD